MTQITILTKKYQIFKIQDGGNDKIRYYPLVQLAGKTMQEEIRAFGFVNMIAKMTNFQKLSRHVMDPAIQDGGRRPYLKYLKTHEIKAKHHISMCKTSKRVLV